MPQLIVKRHNKEILKLNLEEGREYIAGRSQNCDIPLENQKGISRHHFKIRQVSGSWQVELTSRYGSLIFQGEMAEAIQLTEGVFFQVPPYEFSYLTEAREDKQQSHPQKSPSSSSKALATSTHSHHWLTHPNAKTKSQDHLPKPSPTQGNMETTSPGITQLIPHLRILIPSQNKEEILELEGHIWVVGRDVSCEIPIEDGHVSRKHFELTLTNEGAFITDLGSANGTSINGSSLTPHEPRRLQSGDHISIMDISITLELRDPQFKNKLEKVASPQWMEIPLQPQYPAAINPNLYFNPDGPSAIKLDSSQNKFSQFLGDLKKNKIKMTLFILTPLLILGFFFNFQSKDSGKKNNSSQSSMSTAPHFEKLTPDQKSAVKDMFNLARGHYTQGRYELCLAELLKLHEIVPLYEDSKSLQAQCSQGAEMAKENQELERKERLRKEAVQKITYIINDCKKRWNEGATGNQIRDCVGPALELDPSNALVVGLLSEVQAREEAEQQAQIEETNRKARIKAGENQYQKAKELFNKGNLRDSVSEYQKFLQNHYPDSQKLVSTVQREVAMVKKQLETKIQTGLTECKSRYEKKEYRSAIESCDQSLKEDPNNKDLTNLKNEILADLKRELKSLYEDSVLEESLGEIEGAKEKWKKIKNRDVENGEYYLKAQHKLKQYGIGL